MKNINNITLIEEKQFFLILTIFKINIIIDYIYYHNLVRLIALFDSYLFIISDS